MIDRDAVYAVGHREAAEGPTDLLLRWSGYVLV